MAKLLVLASEHVEVDGVPSEIRLMPKGWVHSQKGDFLVDEEAFQMMYQRFKSRKLDLVIDYEHQTLEDMQAPAGGWITDIYLGEDAVMAKVSWNNRAKKYLKNKEYRYLSPVVLVRKKDKRAVVLHSAALTNTPAIDGMFPIVNSLEIDVTENEESENKEDETMNLTVEEILELLGLSKDASKEDVTKAINDMKGAVEKLKEETEKPEVVANSIVLGVLGLGEDAKTEDVVVKIMSLGNGNAEMAQMKEDLKQKEAEESVRLALSEGKLTAAQKDWAMKYALNDPEGFERFVSKAPVVVNMQTMAAQGGADTKQEPQKRDSVECDPVILKACGVSKEDVEKYYMTD